MIFKAVYGDCPRQRNEIFVDDVFPTSKLFFHLIFFGEKTFFFFFQYFVMQCFNCILTDAKLLHEYFESYA